MGLQNVGKLYALETAVDDFKMEYVRQALSEQLEQITNSKGIDVDRIFFGMQNVSKTSNSPIVQSQYEGTLMLHGTDLYRVENQRLRKSYPVSVSQYWMPIRLPEMLSPLVLMDCRNTPLLARVFAWKMGN